MFETIQENLKFMIQEVLAQVEQTLQFFAGPGSALAQKIQDRDSYVDTLKSLIIDRTYRILIESPGMEKRDVQMLRSYNTIAGNLERIADFSVNILRQAEHLSDVTFFNRFEYQSMFEEVLTGIERIEAAIQKRDLSQAFRISQCEFKLDDMYGQNFKQILTGLQTGGHPGNLVTTLMIMHYLERMGDSLLNIGEAIIYAIVGEDLKIQQYRALRETLETAGYETPISEVEFESIWGTRSGCRIGVVGEADQKKPTSRPVLFKHGTLAKLKKEKKNIETWDKLVPGLPPHVHGFVEGQDADGSILLEYLPGCTFQDILLNAGDRLVRDSLFIIEETLAQVYRATMQQETVSAGFVDQLRSRMDAVYRLHPEFKIEPGQIGGVHLPSFGERLRDLERIERHLSAPFSVFIHGDFNINNIIYDSTSERVHFIDLHRSRQTDITQDVSVFLVSIYRLPLLDSTGRRRLNEVALEFFDFAKEFAVSTGDGTFQARLAMGLARSFFTSTRFELNRGFARKMYQLSIYIMSKLAAHQGKPWDAFTLPKQVLIY